MEKVENADMSWDYYEYEHSLYKTHFSQVNGQLFTYSERFDHK